jgi:hypothetical protein
MRYQQETEVDLLIGVIISNVFSKMEIAVSKILVRDSMQRNLMD